MGGGRWPEDVRCCQQNECISIEQLYIKPTRVEQFIDEYTGRVAMASQTFDQRKVDLIGSRHTQKSKTTTELIMQETFYFLARITYLITSLHCRKVQCEGDLPSFIIFEQFICLNGQPLLQEFVELVLRLELTLNDMLNFRITTPR